MSTNDSNLLSNDQSLLPALTGRSPLAGPVASPAWSGTQSAAQPAGGANLIAYLHAVRRHWLMVTALGILCAALLGPAAWFFLGARYSSSAFLRVAPSEKVLVFPTASGEALSGNQNLYDIYKETQSQLLKSRFVLSAALRKPEIAALPSIKRAEPDSVGWLSHELRVAFPGKAEIMEVSMTGDNPQEVASLVNAVVEAYRNEVVDVERNQRVLRKNELDRLCSEKETEVRNKRNDLKQLAEQLGTQDTDVLSLKQQVAVQQFADYRRELVRVEFEAMRARAELKAAKTYMDSLNEVEIPDWEVDSVASADPAIRQMAEQLSMLRMNQSRMVQLVVPGNKSSYGKKLQTDVDVVESQYRQMGESLKTKIRDRKRSETEREIKKLEAEVAILTEQETRFKDDVEHQRKEAEQMGGKSIDIEMMRAEVKSVDQVLANVSEEREKIRVELHSAPRITLLQSAEALDIETGKAVRFAITGFATMVGFCLPLFGIVLWDTRSHRVSAASEVSQGLGLPVIGSVPTIPAQVLRRLGAPTRRSQTWRLRLTESIDGIAARLLRKAETEQAKVVLISSASAGEGKTTLATQLAMSLARHLRNTVLVDFDLRRPALDGVFGVPLEPGVCEALRGKDEVGGMIHPTSTECLSLMPAGQWDRQAMAALANGAAGLLFKQLREKYDFIIVDSSPVLPVADTRFVSQHADIVVLSVFRDLSEVPKIQATCEILDAFGVRDLEAVVTGGQGFSYGREDKDNR